MRGYPPPIGLPKIHFLFFAHNTTNKLGQRKELKQNIFSKILVCAFNPLCHPFKEMRARIWAQGQNHPYINFIVYITFNPMIPMNSLTILTFF